MADKNLILPVYRDELGPAYTHGTGSGTTAMVNLAGGLGAIRGMTFKPGDYVDTTFQINHDIYISGSDITLHPHVHWTAVSAPAAGATVIWEFEYIGTKPTLDGSTTFSASPTLSTSTAHVCDGNETRKHYLTDMPEIVIPLADYGSSYILWGTFRMKATSTVAASKIALLSFDLHKIVQQLGTAGEYA
jgi:hypothetical protein